MVGGMIPDRPACERIRGSIRRHESDDLLRAPMTSSRSGPVALVALLLGLAFAAFYAGTSRGVFVFGDDILMYQVTEAIWERGEVAVASRAPRKDIAHATRGVEGQRFAKYGLGPSLVALPFYGASHRLFDRLELPETADSFGNLRAGPTIFGTGLANAATGGATVAVTFLLAVELGFPLLVALATAFCLGATTLLAHYASTFLSEPLSALCLAVAVLGLLKAKGKGSVKGVAAGRWWLAISGFAAGLAVATKVAHVVVVLPFLLWAAVLGWQRARQRGLVVHSLYWSFFFLRLDRRDRRLQLEPLRQRLRDRLWQRGGQFHDAARRGAERAPGVTGEGGPLVLPGAVSFASRRAGLLAAGSRLRAGDSRGERALAAADLALLPVVRRRQLGAALPGAAPAAVDPARGGDLQPLAAGKRLAGGDRPPCRRQSRRVDGSVAGDVQRARRSANLVEDRLRGSGMAAPRFTAAAVPSRRCRRRSRLRPRSSSGGARSVRAGGQPGGRVSPTSPSSTTARTRCSSGLAAVSWSRRWRWRSPSGWRSALRRREACSFRRRCCRARRSSSRPR